MGRSIVYCDQCGLLLKEGDFAKGKASFQDNRNYCSTCRPLPVAVPEPPPPPPAAPSSGRLPALKAASSGRLPRVAGDSAHRLPSVREPLAAAPKSKPPVALLAGIAAGVLLLIVVLVAALSGGGGRRPERAAEEPRVEPARPKPPPLPSTAAKGSARDAAAREAVVKVLDLARTEPNNLSGQWKAAQEAVDPARGTEFESVLEAEWVRLRKRLSEEIGEVERSARAPRAEEKYRAALDLHEAALKRHAMAEWTGPVGKGLQALQEEIETRFKELAGPAEEARKRGSEAEGRAARERIARWGIPSLVARLDAALAAAAGTPEPPPPPPADPAADARAKEAEAYRGAWKAALLRWPAASPGEALKALEAAAAAVKDADLRKEASADLDELRAAAAFASEAPALAAKIARGQKLLFSYRDPGGAFVRLEGTVSKLDAHRFEVLAGEDPVLILAGELGLATVAEAWRTRPGRKDTDARAAALACLLEGDAEGAEKLSPASGKLKALAPEAAAAANGEKEQAARALWREAEQEFAEAETRIDALARFKALLAEHGGTAFVTRNRGFLASRTEAGREAWFLAADLRPVGDWKQGKHGKVESAWVTQKDVPIEQVKSQFVDLEFAALADVDYKGWVLAGGCCQEVFSFYLQASELMGPDPENPKQKIPIEPGGGSGLPAKPPSSGLKKRHADHTGPKEPDRFEWVALGTFRFAKPGLKTIRILTNQKGFGVAMAAISSVKSGAPSAADVREQERLRAETPGASIRPVPPPTGRLHREVYRGIGGGLQELLNHASFREGKPSEAGLIDSQDSIVSADDFGTRTRGYVYPPASGSYVFMISADDWGELHLSTDEDPAHKTKIAACPEWTAPREYTKHGPQASSPVTLKAGRRYYIEWIQKEGGGGEHVSVAWKLPDGTVQGPIPMDRFAPFAVPAR